MCDVRRVGRTRFVDRTEGAGTRTRAAAIAVEDDGRRNTGPEFPHLVTSRILDAIQIRAVGGDAMIVTRKGFDVDQRDVLGPGQGRRRSSAAHGVQTKCAGIT